MQKQKHSFLTHSDLTGKILKSCFEVIEELGAGFLETIYKNALIIALKQIGLSVEAEKSFEVVFREQKIGFYKADLIVNKEVIVELKCSKSLLPEHQAQLINYLAATRLPVGLLINFGNRTLQYKRVYHPLFYPAAAFSGDPASEADPVPY